MDNPEAGLLFFLILLCTAANALFALSETAISESRKTRLERLAEDGNTKALAALKILDAPEHILAVMQIGITFMSILLGTTAGALIAPRIAKSLVFLPHAEAFSLIVSMIVITYVNLLFGEFLPKKIALQDPEKILLRYGKILLKIELISRPSVSFLARSANIVLLLFGINPHIEDTVTEDEVKDLIEQGTEDGTFEKTEQAMVDRIFHMSDQTAYSLMTPRTQMLWLDLEDPAAYNLALIKEHPDNVFPVGKNNLDDFCGILYAKDLLNAAIEKQPLVLTEYIKKPLLIPRSMETFRVLEKFRKEHVREAVVLDEYGGVIGFITLDDIIEEIIGDTVGDNEPDPIQVTQRDENSWYIDGLFSIDDFKERFAIDKLPNEDKDHYQTMGGFLTSYFGYIPKVAETCTWEDLTFEIVDMDRARIDKILLTKKPVRPSAAHNLTNSDSSL